MSHGISYIMNKFTVLFIGDLGLADVKCRNRCNAGTIGSDRVASLIRQTGKTFCRYIPEIWQHFFYCLFCIQTWLLCQRTKTAKYQENGGGVFWHKTITAHGILTVLKVVNPLFHY